MVQRNYEGVQFGVQDRREVRASQVTQADTRANTPIQVGDSTWRDRMFENMGREWSQTFDNLGGIELEAQYLEGAAQAGIAKSEAELQGDPLTRDWKVAGYRDTMNKLALADTEAQFAVDLPRLREQGEDKVHEYLAARRNKLMPAMAGSSREARASMTGQLLLQDNASIKKWHAEHAKFIVEKKAQAVHTQVGVQIRSLKQSQLELGGGNTMPEAFQAQLQSTAGTIAGSVWGDGSLGAPHKQDITFGVLEHALSENATTLYEYIRDTKMPDADVEGGSTLLSRLTGEQQTKLADQFRSAMTRTSDARNLYRLQQFAELQAQVSSDTYKDTYENLASRTGEMVQNGAITGEARAGLLRDYNVRQLKRGQNSDLGAALTRGDTNFIFGSGATIEKAADALTETMAANGVQGPQRLETWLTVGMNAHEIGFKRAAEELAPALRQMRLPDGTMLPQHVATFRRVHQAIQQAELKGLNNARATLLSGLNEADQMFAERIFRHKGTYDEAVANAMDVETREKAMSPALKAATSQQTAKAVDAEIKAIEPIGLFESGWLAIKSWMPWDDDSAATRQIAPRSGMNARDGYFSDSASVKFYTQKARDELTADANAVLFMHPHADPAEVISTAKARLAARTVQTQHGPLYMPSGYDAAKTFGVSPANAVMVGPALDALLSTNKSDSTWQLSFTQGRLWAQEYSKAGERIGNGKFIMPNDVRTKVQEITNGEATKAAAMFGEGSEVKLPEGGAIRFNGVNKTGVPVEWMYGFRNNLVNHEGVRGTAYDDATGKPVPPGEKPKGKLTVGIGVMEQNPHYPKPRADGTIDPNDIRKSFLGASEDAAAAGANVARSVGRYNEAGFQLMSELAYHSGVNFATQRNSVGDKYREFASRVRGNDVAAAQEAFKATAAWRASADRKNPDKPSRRQQSYLNLIEKSMKG